MERRQYWAIQNKETPLQIYGLTERQVQLLFHIGLGELTPGWQFRRAWDDKWTSFSATKDKVLLNPPSWAKLPISDDATRF